MVCLHVYLSVCVLGTCLIVTEGRKRVLDPLGLEIQMVVSCCCMLGVNTGPNYCAISLTFVV